MKIYKTSLSAGVTSIPNCLSILSVGNQNEVLTAWYLHEDDAMTLKVGVYVTGASLPQALELSHLGTVLLDDGALVLHVFLLP